MVCLQDQGTKEGLRETRSECLLCLSGVVDFQETWLAGILYVSNRHYVCVLNLFPGAADMGIPAQKCFHALLESNCIKRNCSIACAAHFHIMEAVAIITAQAIRIARHYVVGEATVNGFPASTFLEKAWDQGPLFSDTHEHHHQGRCVG